MQTWVLDVSIGKSDKHAPTDVDNIVAEIRRLQAPIVSRERLYDYIEQRGYSLGFRMWMGSNLVSDGQGRLKWGFNVEGANGKLVISP